MISPKTGDTVVSYKEHKGFAIERRASDGGWEQIAFEKDRLAGLRLALME